MNNMNKQSQRIMHKLFYKVKKEVLLHAKMNQKRKYMLKDV